MKIMKYIYLSSLMIALSAFFLIGCENAEYKAQSNSLYITDAAGTNNATTVTMDDGADINVVVRLAQKVMEDVEVEIQFSPELLAEYNATSGTEYEVLPADMLPKNATARMRLQTPCCSLEKTPAKLHAEEKIEQKPAVKTEPEKENIPCDEPVKKPETVFNGKLITEAIAKELTAQKGGTLTIKKA